MIDLDALKAELEAAGCVIVMHHNGQVSWVRDSVGGGVTNLGNVQMNAARQPDILAIIARHVAPVVTPEPDAEVRDVLAEVLDDIADLEPPGFELEVADRSLSALRGKGFAVVRTADVEPRTCAGCKLATPRVAGETMMCGLWGAEVAVSFSCAAWEAIR